MLLSNKKEWTLNLYKIQTNIKVLLTETSSPGEVYRTRDLLTSYAD